MGCLTFVAAKATCFFPATSGVSSVSPLSAGEDSAPEVSEKRSASKGFRGVVKEGLRKGVALAGVAENENWFGLLRGFEGESKPPIFISIYATNKPES